MLFDKLRQIEERSNEIARALSDPAIFSQPTEYARLRKEHAETVEIVERFTTYRDILRRIGEARDRKSTRLNSSHVAISYAVFCLKKKNKKKHILLTTTTHTTHNPHHNPRINVHSITN